MVMISDNHVTAETRRHPRWPGWVVLAACAVSGCVFSVRGRPSAIGYSGTLYDGCRWLLLGLLVVAGIGLLDRKRAEVTRVAAILGAIAAVQLVTTGIVAAKHWHPLSGSLGYGSANLSTLVFLAWILIVVAGIATIACVAAARAAGVTGRSRYRWIALVVGAAIAVALPLVLGYHHGHMMGLRSLAAYALLYSLPWGAAIAVSGWLDRVVALTALATVVVSAAGAVVSHDILPVASPSHGFVPVVVVTIALAALMFRERRQVREAGEATENSDV
jgi:hypothetical protein